MLSADAIKEIAGMAQSTMVEVDGVKFHQTHDAMSAINFPTEDSVNVFSLNQLVSFLSETKHEGKVFVNLTAHNKVQAIRAEKNKNLKTQIIVQASFENQFEPFKESSRLSQEDLIIQLQSRFLRDENVETLIKLVSSVSAGKTSDVTDNGYAQAATLKSGVHLVTSDQQAIKPIWDLRPYRSFPEVDPVAIPFILRLHQRNEEMPTFALYEADGGRWKIETTEKIRSFLANQLEDVENVVVL